MTVMCSIERDSAWHSCTCKEGSRFIMLHAKHGHLSFLFVLIFDRSVSHKSLDTACYEKKPGCHDNLLTETFFSGTSNPLPFKVVVYAHIVKHDTVSYSVCKEVLYSCMNDV